MADVFLNDNGTIFHFTVSEGGVPVDISGATTLTVKFMRKDKTTFARTGTFETDGTDGKIVYTTTATTDIDQIGKWFAQVYIVLPSWEGHSGKINFTVLDPIAVA